MYLRVNLALLCELSMVESLVFKVVKTVQNVLLYLHFTEKFAFSKNIFMSNEILQNCCAVWLKSETKPKPKTRT